MSGFLVSMAGGDLRGWAMGEDDDELEWETLNGWAGVCWKNGMVGWNGWDALEWLGWDWL